MKIFQDFKEFAAKGNVVDLAMAVVVGAAFSKVTTSLVKDIITPPLGLVIGKVNFEQLRITLQPANTDATGTVITPEIAVHYGSFLQVCLDFLLITLALFLVIKGLNVLKNKAEDIFDNSVPTPQNIKLLSDIKDLLKGDGQKPS